MDDSPLLQECPTCGVAIDISDEEPLAQIACPACGTEQAVSGQVDQYELQSVVGRGGMGVVYRAYDAGLDRFVALKLLRRDMTANPTIVAQLEKEAAVTASINHPHVVRVFTSGTDHGRFFIAMELVDKGTLDDLIHLQGRVAEPQVLEVGIQIAQGLRAAQQAGLIHRDVKPGNILFADAHTAKIVDFGLAIFMSEEEKQRGEVWGTPYYVAPEKLDQKPEDFRSDMYSLGGTLFHALAGRPPFEAEDASMVALKHLKSEAVSLQAFAPHVSGETAYVINRTLSKNPDDRYQSYDEFIEHLEYALEEMKKHGGQPVQKKRVVLEDEQQQKAMGWLTIVMALLIILAGVGLFVFRKQILPSDEAARIAVTPAPAETATAPEPTGPFAEARAKLLSGDAAGATAQYHEISGDAKYSPLQQQWSRYGEGLALLLSGKLTEARGAFDAVESRPQYNVSGGDEKVDTFLRDTARELANPLPLKPDDTKNFDRTSHEAIGLLAYGMKDFQLGHFDDATSLLRNFRDATPGGHSAWIAELKPLATNLIENYASFQMNTQRLKSAKRPEIYKRTVTALQKLGGSFAALTADLEKNYPSPKAIVLPKLGDWSQAEFGPPDIPGNASLDTTEGALTIKAAGNEFWGGSDTGHFVYREMNGDGELSAHFESLEKADKWSKAGLMMRENLKGDSRNAALVVAAGGGLAQQVRVKQGSSTTDAKASGSIPIWLKLVRQGDTFTGFQSPDGQNWTKIADQKNEKLPPKLLIGFVTASHNGGKPTVAKIDHITFTPKP